MEVCELYPTVIAHLGFNVLLTILLGASNYTKQCLSLLIQKDINEAHRQDLSLNIST